MAQPNYKWVFYEGFNITFTVSVQYELCNPSEINDVIYYHCYKIMIV